MRGTSTSIYSRIVKVVNSYLTMHARKYNSCIKIQSCLNQTTSTNNNMTSTNQYVFNFYRHRANYKLEFIHHQIKFFTTSCLVCWTLFHLEIRHDMQARSSRNAVPSIGVTRNLRASTVCRGHWPCSLCWGVTWAHGPAHWSDAGNIDRIETSISLPENRALA